MRSLQGLIFLMEATIYAKIHFPRIQQFPNNVEESGKILKNSFYRQFINSRANSREPLVLELQISSSFCLKAFNFKHLQLFSCCRLVLLEATRPSNDSLDILLKEHLELFNQRELPTRSHNATFPSPCDETSLTRPPFIRITCSSSIVI